jgi:hypothetical protein
VNPELFAFLPDVGSGIMSPERFLMNDDLSKSSLNSAHGTYSPRSGWKIFKSLSEAPLWYTKYLSFFYLAWGIYSIVLSERIITSFA